MKVRCPHCKTIKTIDKTDKNIQVRCGKREGGCGERFYIKENIVLEKETNKDKKGTKIIEELSIGNDFDRTVLIAGLMDTIKIYKNVVLNRDGKRLTKRNSSEGKRTLEWVEQYENQVAVPMLVVYSTYFQKVHLAYKELKKLRL